ncbi:MAG: hypothetical protein HY287_15825 [Planctomycetes bacterium]|nr:hypothetical protein [Planctomycetota bacterium]MBI3835795.1 hypothetical protein [Planctomycetota bacterium]
MRKVIWGLLFLLAVLHQDFWNWNRIDPLIFDFIPIGLAYQIGVSIVAAILWAFAVHYCWPKDVDVPDSEAFDATPQGVGRSAHV